MELLAVFMEGAIFGEHTRGKKLILSRRLKMSFMHSKQSGLHLKKYLFLVRGKRVIPMHHLR
jgi:hypothetical protein